MNRVLADKLSLTDKGYLKDGTLFSGVVFWKHDNKEITAKNVSNGEIISDYRPLCLPNYVNDIFIMYSDDAIDLDCDYYEFSKIANDPNLFTGIIVWFEDNGISAGESYYINSNLVADCGWYLDTESISNYRFDYDWFSVQTEWYKANTLKSYRVWHDAGLIIHFNEMNEVTLISIARKFFDYSDKFFEQSQDMPFRNYQQFLNLKYANEVCFLDNLTLDVNGIQKSLLADLIANDSLNNTKHIKFQNITHIDETLLNALKSDCNATYSL